MIFVDEREISNIYAIPANFTDSGKLLGGLLEVRNTIEAVLLVGLIGYPEVLLPLPGTMKVVVMTVTLLPLGIVALMGIAGDSLLQYAGHMLRHWTRRRKLHYRRIGYRYEDRKYNPPQKGAKKKRGQRKNG